MLTIQNINRLLNGKVGTEWEVTSAFEGTSTYYITIKHTLGFFPYQRVIELSRIADLQSNGNYEYFFINEQGRKTHTSLRLEQIKDINNILKALNWFAC